MAHAITARLGGHEGNVAVTLIRAASADAQHEPVQQPERRHADRCDPEPPEERSRVRRARDEPGRRECGGQGEHDRTDATRQPDQCCDEAATTPSILTSHPADTPSGLR